MHRVLSPEAAEAAALAVERAALTTASAVRLRVAVSEGLAAHFSGTAEGAEHVDMALGTFARGAAPAHTDAGASLHYYLAQCSIATGVGSPPPQAPALGAALLAALPLAAPDAPLAAQWPPACAAAALAAALPQGTPAPAFQQANLWWCAGSAATGTHFDASHNLLLVLRGVKRVALLPPEAGPYLGEAPLAHATPNHATVALWGLPVGAPLAASAPQLLPTPGLPPHIAARGLTATLEPGAALFIPEGWWHAVVSAPRTMAVNFWCAGGAQLAVPGSERYHVRMGLLALAREERARMAREARAAAAAAGHGAEPELPVGGCSGWDAALCAASAVRGRALALLLRALQAQPQALGALLQRLQPLTVEALQAAWEAEEEEEAGGGEAAGGEAAGAARAGRGQRFQALWAGAFPQAGDAAAAWLAGAREQCTAQALARVVASLNL